MRFHTGQFLVGLVGLGTAAACGPLAPEGRDGELGSSSEALSGTSDYGWVFAQQTSEGFISSGIVSANSSSTDPNASNVLNGVTGQGGTFRVTMPNLGVAVGGNVQVTAYEGGGSRCKVVDWLSNGSDLLIDVACFTAAGAPVTNQFLLSYYRETSASAGVGYVWAYEPTTASYTPTGPYSFNSSSAPITITRSGTGVYAVSFPGLTGTTGGVAHVTAYGGGSEYCKVASWATGTSGGTTVNVRCFNTVGSPADALFSLVFGRQTPIGGKSYAYRWSDPDPGIYQAGYVYAESVQSHAINNITITGTGTGMYKAFVPDMSQVHANSMVTAYGTGSESCKIEDVFLNTNPPGNNVNVGCYSANGTPANSRFTLSYDTASYSAWTPFTSEEFPPAYCVNASGLNGARCTNSYCDNMSLWCEDLPAGTAIDHAMDTWTPSFSEENAGISQATCIDYPNGGFCSTRQLNQGLCPGGIVTGLKCTGSYCDNIQLLCSKLTAGHLDTSRCVWTTPQSEEQGASFFATGSFAQGAACTGRYCDNVSFKVCPLVP